MEREWKAWAEPPPALGKGRPSRAHGGPGRGPSALGCCHQSAPVSPKGPAHDGYSHVSVSGALTWVLVPSSRCPHRASGSTRRALSSCFRDEISEIRWLFVSDHTHPSFRHSIRVEHT